MKKDLKRPCPICNARTAEVLHTQNFVLLEGHPLAKGYDVVCCDDCGFTYADTAVNQAEYDAFYARFSKYEDNRTSTGGGEYEWDAERLQNTAHYVAKALMNSDARILDVGCANGGLLKCFKDLGYRNLHGIDPSPACVDHTKRFGGIEATVASLSASQVAKLGRFDCIILSHVLEHVQDLQPFMRHVSELVAEAGLAYIEVPDALRYADYIVAPFQDFNTEHINHFSLKCLGNLTRQFSLTSYDQGGKVINSAPGKPYPAIYGLYAKVNARLEASFQRDAQLREKITEYISRSEEVMKRIKRNLREALDRHGEVIVWGTGQLTMKLLAETSLAQAAVVLVDGNPVNHGQVVNGKVILAPQQIKGMKQPIVVSSMLHEEAITNTVRRQMALPNEVILLD